MSANTKASRPYRPLLAVTIRILILALTLATAWIHSTLGGALFTLNAFGYTALAIAMIAPGPIGRLRWLVRLALMAFASATVVGWLLFGAWFSLAYLDKGIELVLITLVAVEVCREDGGVAGIVQRLSRIAFAMLDAPAASSAR